MEDLVIKQFLESLVELLQMYNFDVTPSSWGRGKDNLAMGMSWDYDNQPVELHNILTTNGYKNFCISAYWNEVESTSSRWLLLSFHPIHSTIDIADFIKS